MARVLCFLQPCRAFVFEKYKIYVNIYVKIYFNIFHYHWLSIKTIISRFVNTNYYPSTVPYFTVRSFSLCFIGSWNCVFWVWLCINSISTPSGRPIRRGLHQAAGQSTGAICGHIWRRLRGVRVVVVFHLQGLQGQWWRLMEGCSHKHLQSGAIIDAIGDSETLGGIQYIPPWYFIPVYVPFK